MTQDDCVQLDHVLQMYHLGYHRGDRPSSIHEPQVESATSITVQQCPIVEEPPLLMVITGVLVGSALAADESSPLLIVMTEVLVGGTLGADESPPLLMVISVAAAAHCSGGETARSCGGTGCVTVGGCVFCCGRGSRRSIGAALSRGDNNRRRRTGRSGTGTAGGAVESARRGGAGRGACGG